MFTVRPYCVHGGYSVECQTYTVFMEAADIMYVRSYCVHGGCNVEWQAYTVFIEAAMLHVRPYAVFSKTAVSFQTIVVLFVLV